MINRSAIRNRLYSLFSRLGLNCKSGYALAELESYAEGIGLVNDYVDKMLSDIVFMQGFSRDYSNYSELIGTYLHNYGWAPERMVSQRFGNPWGSFTQDEIEDALRGVSKRFAFSFSDKSFYADFFENENLKRFGDFVRGYVPVGCRVHAGLPKATCEDWDGFVKSWYEFDNFDARFDFLDTMEVVQNE